MVKRNSVKRYKLIIKSPEFDYAYISESGQEKFALTEIDSITTQYSSPQQFAIANKLDPETNKLIINYKANKQERYLFAIFDEYDFLSRLASDNNGLYTVTPGVYFQAEVREIINKLMTDDELYLYLLKMKYIDPKLNERILDFINALKHGYKKDIQFNYKRLENFLVRYKTIRGLEIGIKTYEKLTNPEKQEEKVITNIEEEMKEIKEEIKELKEEKQDTVMIDSNQNENYVQGTLFDMQATPKKKVKQKEKKIGKADRPFCYY